MSNPNNLLLSYQRAFVDDKARFKLFVASRQIGKSFVLAFEAVRDCVLNPNREWVCVSRGERQSQKWLEKARTLSVIWREFAKENGLFVSVVRDNSTIIKFSNGSTITALPANSDTIRGYTANVILDEFAYHDRPEKLWEAIFPSISNGINTNLRLIVASTLNGKNNKFWELFAEENNFAKYKVNIHQAVACGLPMNIDELKDGIGDEDAWKQEYECIPVESGSALVSRDLVEIAQKNFANCSREITLRELNESFRSFYVGVDIGRKHDLTCIWILEAVQGANLRTCTIRELNKMTFAQQREEIAKILSCRAIRKCCIDCTGIGAQLSEELASMFGALVEQCQFTAGLKQEIFTAMQRGFQQGQIWLPRDIKGDLSRDICAIKKVFTSSGNVGYFAPSNEDGHSDRATALALAIRASNVIDGKQHSTSAGFGFRAPRAFGSAKYSNGL